MKEVVAKLFKKAAKANVVSVSGFFGYQPEMPQAMKKEEE